MASNERRESERSLTWPPTIRVVSGDSPVHKPELGSMSAAPQSKPINDYFDDDLESNPENHFLSAVEMHEYDDWTSDSDDDDAEEVEWDAGITDFALFDNDRRRAEESQQPLPSKWNNMLAQQAGALQRAVERSRPDSYLAPGNRPLSSEEDLPSLTPDSSPNLRDDLDVESYHGQTQARPTVPSYLTITITPPEASSSDEAVEDGDDDLPLSFYVARKQALSARTRRMERPGLRHSRTMSGRVHVWQRPSIDIYPVGEDPDAERRAELATIQRASSYHGNVQNQGWRSQTGEN